MTPDEFYKRMAEIVETHTIITLSPGPLRLSVGPQDAMAAKLLLWLMDQMPEAATVGDVDAVLDATKFWSTFWSSLERQ